MSTRPTHRPLALLLAAITLVGAAQTAGAQAPVKTQTRSGTGGALLSDCDSTQGSCGGTPYLDGYGVGGGGSPITGGGYNGGSTGGASAGPTYLCDGGNLTECLRVSTTTCTSWVYTQGNGTLSGNVGPTAGGSLTGGWTRTCAEMTTVTSVVRLRKVN